MKQDINPGQASNLMTIYRQRNYPSVQHGKLDKDQVTGIFQAIPAPETSNLSDQD